MSEGVCLALYEAAEVLFFILFIYAGARAAEKGKFNGDAIPYGAVVTMLCASFMILRFNELPQGITSVPSKLSLSNLRCVLLDNEINGNFILGIISLMASGVFWFFGGIFTYRLLKEIWHIPAGSKIRTRVIATPLLLPVALILSMTFRGVRTIKGIRRGADLVLNYNVFFRCFKLFLMFIVFVLLSWLFIRVMKKEILGAVVMAVFVIFFLRGTVNNMLVIGGANHIMFPIGLMAAKYSEALTGFLKKRYKRMLVISSVIFVISILICGYCYSIAELLRKYMGFRSRYFYRLTSCYPETNWLPGFTVTYFLASVSLCVLILLTLLKLRIGNPVSVLMSASLFEFIWLSTLYYDRGFRADDVFSERMWNYLAVPAAYIPVAVILMCILSGRKPSAVVSDADDTGIRK